MPRTKYSALVRILAFLAVSCSIVAVAWVIRDPLLIAIGVPGLAAGHFYSWRRRDASIRRSLVLLLFMVLTAFLGGDILLSGFSDRLLLSRYLIYGLVIGSFDLMRRRNVIASLILGGLLLVLISELALNWWFLVFPVGYIALALAAIAIGRIDADTNQVVLVDEFRWLTTGKFWLGVSASTLLISTSFFLLMPRLTSSQMRQAVWLPSRLDLSLGGFSMLPSKPSAAPAPGILASSQDGGVGGNGQYATLGYTGNEADRPVMQVRSRISSYWRGLTMTRYDGQGWLGSSTQLTLRNESRREFTLPDTRIGTSGRRSYWQAFYLLSDQPNAVFTGYWPGRIYLPAEPTAFLESGTLYRVLSLVPNLQPGQLRRDSVVSDDVSNLALPPISERVSALAESIVAGAATDYDKAARLELFLLTNYPYDLSVGPLPPGHDAVDYFLFEQQAGYCAHFATAMAVMARQVGLPARVAAGYMPGVIDPLTGAHVVRVGDAHAWVEINFQQHGWVAFDPTPRPDAAMGFATGRNWVYFGLEEFTGVTLASILSPLAGSFSLGSLSLPGWAWVVLLGSGIAIAWLVLLFRRRQTATKQEIRGYGTLEGEARKSMLSLYRKMGALLVRKGLPSRQPHQPPYEYAAVIYADIAGGLETVEWLTQAACRAAYDPHPFDPSIVAEARQRLATLPPALSSR